MPYASFMAWKRLYHGKTAKRPKASANGPEFVELVVEPPLPSRRACPPYCPKTRLQQEVLVIKQSEAFGVGNSEVFSELRSRQYFEMDVLKLLLVSLAGWMNRRQ